MDNPIGATKPLCEESMRAGALFSGIGGFCMGFHRVGVPTAWAVEMDPFAVATYKANFPTVYTLQRDVRGVCLGDTNLEPVEILHAGFPCQSFSQAGGGDLMIPVVGFSTKSFASSRSSETVSPRP
ncbi:MAG TPA: DNA cytosine methyltransferase [Candidatus Binataceae bacterium]|nr:DNA cytosine methyltransferase [Candidatus Binataceae bacterium]